MMHPRFTMSDLFQSFLETLVIVEEGGPSDHGQTSLLCTECSETLCLVEADDTLGVLVRTAMAHDNECPARQAQVNYTTGATRSTD